MGGNTCRHFIAPAKWPRQPAPLSSRPCCRAGAPARHVGSHRRRRSPSWSPGHHPTRPGPTWAPRWGISGGVAIGFKSLQRGMQHQTAHPTAPPRLTAADEGLPPERGQGSGPWLEQKSSKSIHDTPPVPHSLFFAASSAQFLAGQTAVCDFHAFVLMDLGVRSCHRGSPHDGRLFRQTHANKYVQGGPSGSWLVLPHQCGQLMDAGNSTLLPRGRSSTALLQLLDIAKILRAARALLVAE